MRGITILLLTTLLLINVTAEGTSTTTSFTIEGCVTEEESIAIGSCSKEGTYFCEKGTGTQEPRLYDTLNDKKGCSYGKNSVQTTQCCPAGYVCDATSLTCEPRTGTCESYTKESQCSTNGCYWIVGPDVCIQGKKSFSCNFYNTEQACKNDLWNLGSTGLGTEACGNIFKTNYQNKQQTFFTSTTNCGCEWDRTTKECTLAYNVGQDLYPEGQSEGAHSFTCKKTIEASLCEAGEQTIDTTARITNIKGFTGDYNNIIRGAECESEQQQTNCGEQTLQLPFYGTQALITTLLTLLLYYATLYRHKNL